jgi:Kef-type K+ transport system membrane component KefB
MTAVHHFFDSLGFNLVFLAGFFIIIGFYAGKLISKTKVLPALLGYMVIGIIFGPSALGLLSETGKESLSFITNVALGFVAITIGLELKFTTLKKQGLAMILIIFTESFLAFALVTLFIWLLTKNVALALIFGAVAPASAPAGTVAVIRENRAKGPLTSALYTVVGFDDGLGIIIFGFASAIAKSVLNSSSGEEMNTAMLILEPLKEIGLSVLVGVLFGLLVVFLIKFLKNDQDLMVVLVGVVLASTGLAVKLGISLILTNMIVGMFIVNTQNSRAVHRISESFEHLMPTLFVLFFMLAGANLHLAALPKLGLIGLVYIVGRTSGLMGGAFAGAVIGKADSNIRKYLGMGILSQAGVAIGLSLIVQKDFAKLPGGAYVGATVLTTVTATCVFFEVIGPILTKIGLAKAGEINVK